MRLHDFFEAESNSAARAWIEKVYAKYPHTMQNNHVMIWGSGEEQQFAMFELVPSFSKRGAVEVKWIQAYPLRQGVGSRAMKELQALAREDGISLTLFPWDKGQVSQSKLTKFYRGQGFTPTVKGGKGMQWSPELNELFDPETAFPLKWDQQFAAQGEIHASATDADGREIGISFTPVGNGEITDVAFTRGGTHEMTGKGDAARVMSTVIKAINMYAKKYKPPYLVFSAKSGGGRASAYTAMIRRAAQGYELLPADRYPAALGNYLEFIGSDQPFVLARV
jgi:hypothetical protein